MEKNQRENESTQISPFSTTNRFISYLEGDEVMGGEVCSHEDSHLIPSWS